MKQIPLYIDNRKRYFYVTQEELFCESCNDELINLVFIRIKWDKQSQIGLLCHNCTNNIMFQAQVEEWKLAEITNEKRKDFVPILIMFGGLKNSDRNLTVFDSEEIKSDEVSDKTKFAGRESWGGSLIGNNPKEIISKLDSTKEEDIELLSCQILNSKIVLPEYKEVELLEEGKDK